MDRKNKLKFSKLNWIYIGLIIGTLIQISFTIFAIIYEKNSGESLYIGSFGFFLILLTDIYSFIVLIYLIIKKYDKPLRLPFLINLIGVIYLILSLIILIILEYLDLQFGMLDFLLSSSLLVYYATKLLSLWKSLEILKTNNRSNLSKLK